MSNGTTNVNTENVHEAIALIENVIGDLPFGSSPHKDLLKLKMIHLNMLLGTDFNTDALVTNVVTQR